MRTQHAALVTLVALTSGCAASVHFRVFHRGELARLNARSLQLASVDGPADSRLFVRQALEQTIVSDLPPTMATVSAPWDSARDFVVDVTVTRSDARTESSLGSWQPVYRPGARCPGETRSSTAWIAATFTVRPVTGTVPARPPLTFASTGYGYLHRPSGPCDSFFAGYFLANSIAYAFSDPTREQAFRQAANEIALKARRALWGWEQDASALVLACDDGRCAQAVELARRRAFASAEAMIAQSVARLCASTTPANNARAEPCARARYNAALVALLHGDAQRSRALAREAEPFAREAFTMDAIDALRVDLGPSDTRLLEAH